LLLLKVRILSLRKKSELIEYIKVKKSKDKNNPLLNSTKAKLSIKYKIIKLN